MMLNIKELIQKYNELEQEILDRFNYERNWDIAPLDNCTDYYWFINSGGDVNWSEEPYDMKNIGEGYSAAIIGKVYRAGGFVLIHGDTQCDGDDFLMIFDEEKEVKEEELEKLYAKYI